MDWVRTLYATAASSQMRTWEVWWLKSCARGAQRAPAALLHAAQAACMRLSGCREAAGARLLEGDRRATPHVFNAGGGRCCTAALLHAAAGACMQLGAALREWARTCLKETGVPFHEHLGLAAKSWLQQSTGPPAACGGCRRRDQAPKCDGRR